MWSQMNKMKSITIANDYNIACIFHLFYSLLAFIWICYVWGQKCLCFWQGKYVLSKPCSEFKESRARAIYSIFFISKSIGNRAYIGSIGNSTLSGNYFLPLILKENRFQKIHTKSNGNNFLKLLWKFTKFRIFFVFLFFGRKCFKFFF